MPFHISDAWKSGERIVDSAIRLLPNVILGIIVFVLFLFLGSFTKWFIRRAAERRNASRVGLALLLGRLGQLVMVILGILIAFAIAAPSFKAGDLIKMLGIGSVAIGFAFQNILQNFLAGILILIHQPFHLGDTISVSGMEGTVEDIQARATVIRTKEGNTVVIPNATVFTNPVTVDRVPKKADASPNQNPPNASGANSQRTDGAKQQDKQDKRKDQESGAERKSGAQGKNGENHHEEVEAGHSSRAPHFFSC